MKQRLLLTLLVLSLTVVAKAQGNTAPAVKDGISYHINYDKKTAKVIAPINFNGKKKEYIGNIVIPETIRFTAEDATVLNESMTGYVQFGTDYTVTEISTEAFKNDVTTGVEIPGTVDEIPDGCFTYCSNLRNVIIHYGVQRIGRYAFCEIVPYEWNGKIYSVYQVLEHLESVIFNSTVTSLTLGKGKCKIDDYAFYNCSKPIKKLELRFIESFGSSSIPLAENVIIGRDIVFEKATFIQGLNSYNYYNSINVENGNPIYDSRENCNAVIETASNSLITGCKNTIIPNSVTSIGTEAFHRCTGLTSITIPNSVTSIGGCAFMDCTNLTSLNIPNSVTNIGDGAFFNCTSLVKINIPESIKEIGKQTFQYCTNLTSITIPDSVTEIGYQAFAGCTSLTDFYFPISVANMGALVFWGCTGLTDITYTSSIIGEQMFAACTNLKSVVVPSYVDSIGLNPFRDCTNLTSIQVDKDNNHYDSRDNCNAIIKTASNALISGCKTSTIPSYVIKIENWAFMGSGIASVIIPTSITNIGNFAFSNCTDMTDIYALRINPSDYNCSAVAFDRFIDSDNDFTPFSTCTLHVPTGCKEAYAACEPWSSFKNIIEDANVIDGLYYILDKDNMTAGITNSDNKYTGTIHIPSTITYDGSTYKMTSIEEKAFYEFKSLTRITIPESVTKIGDYSFYGCTNLKEIYCLNKIPPTLGNDALPDGLQTTSATPSLKEENGCILYVPIGCREAYSEAWNIPTSRIVEIEVTAIEKTQTTPTEAHPIGYYNLQGQRINKPQSGIVIVRYSDGTNRKMLVK